MAKPASVTRKSKRGQKEAVDARARSLPYAAELGRRIAEVRGTKGQAEFARSLDISKSTLGNYERGVHLPDAWIVSQIVELYDVNSTWLLTGAGSRRRSDRLSRDELRELARRDAPPMVEELMTRCFAAVKRVFDERVTQGPSEDKQFDLALQVYGLVTMSQRNATPVELSKIDAEALYAAALFLVGIQMRPQPVADER